MKMMSREEAIGELKAMREPLLPYMSVIGTDAYDMAIRSLEAWDEVLHEIGSLGLAWEYGRGVLDCYNIIKKHLEEVEE
jgi:hypothetical protein